ncbi:MAG: hypothetical protein RLY87_984 [Chloroflexota bacterium]|jgi:hypothetical protein
MSAVVRLTKLPIIVTLAGAGTLALEMLAPRLLAPAFGTSQPIWAAVIGMTLLYLAIGYHIGGRLADGARGTDADMVSRIIVWAGVSAALIAPVAPPLISGARVALQSLAIGSFVGALIIALVLFATPIILLAAVSPFVSRLALTVTEPERVGRVLGRLSMFATVGSLAGTFFTTLWLIPTLGTSLSLLAIAGFLIVLGTWAGDQPRRGLWLLLVLALVGWRLMNGPAPLAAGCIDCTVQQTIESANNTIQVATRPHPTHGTQTLLLLNEGMAVHSVSNEAGMRSGAAIDMLTDGGPWDYFAVAPYVLPQQRVGSIKRMAMIGSAAGTGTAQFLAIHGPDAEVDAIEIDPAIVAVARQSFGMRDSATAGGNPNYRVHVADGRTWLAAQTGSYDIIGVDAYHQPYIPFHLTTVEFFEMAKARLTPNGALVLNAGLGANGDIRLAQALATTMRQVFTSVFVLETASYGNWMLIGTIAHIGDGAANFAANYQIMTDPAIRQVMEKTQGFPFLQSDDGPIVLYDDHAPVEKLVDEMIFGTIAQ